MPTKINFTKRELEKLPMPTSDRVVYLDQYQHNLLLRVSSAGSKVFYVRRKVNGRSQRIQLGRFPDMSIEQARKAASAILTEIAQGRHPKQAARAARSEPTLAELFQNYITGHAREHCVRVADMEKEFERYLSTWKTKQWSEIRRNDVQLKVRHVRETHGPGSANHMIILMRAAINWNLKQEIISGENPWTSVRQIRIDPRERFLKPDELVRFFRVLAETSDATMRDYVLMSLYTGARRSNVLAMRWDQVDFNLRIWTIPPERVKNKQTHVVPLTSNALSLLKERQDVVKGEWVFPGKVPGHHLVEPKKAWSRILKLAEIEDLRLHDLRRTLASYMAMGNQSLPVIAKALGHKTTAATQIYSRLMSDPVRDAMEKAQTDMFNAVDVFEAEVV